jgi:predicted permease
MEEELRFHMQSYADDLCKKGVEKSEAWRRARLEFGPVEAHKEDCRASLGLRLWDELCSDLRSGVRVLRQSPVFTVVAIASLALGIGANTAIFALANQVLLKNMAVPHPERLRLFTWVQGREGHVGHAWGSFDKNDKGEMVGTPFPYPLYQEMRRHTGVMEDLAGFKDIYRLTATVGGEAEPVDGILVSGNFYQTLRVPLEAGRPITPADDSPGANAVAVISDAYWARRFGRSADALGGTIRLNRVPLTIVGVNAAEFKGPKAGGTAEVFLPISLQPAVIPNAAGSLLTQNAIWWMMMIGPLKPAVTDAEANTELSAVFRAAFRTTLPEKKDIDRPRLALNAGNRGVDMQIKEFQKSIYLLISLAGLVLLIACANLANLLLARASARQREISLRLAMGAGRWRIMRQILTESLLLAFLGGAAGLLLGYAARDVIPDLFENAWRAPSLEVQIDWRVFLFAFGITLATGLLFGLVPAWRATQEDAHAALKETNRMSMGHSKALLGKSLVVFQVAVSLVLVVGAGLFVRTLVNLRTAPTGINPEHIVLFELNPPQSHYTVANRIRLFQEIEEGLSQLPGVQHATLSSEPLLAQSLDDYCFRPLRKDWDTNKHPGTLTNFVGADFFSTYGMRVVAGRGIELRDTPQAPKVAVINQGLAKEFFPNGSALGRSIVSCSANSIPIEIVGISADAKYDRIRGEAPPTIYVPYTQTEELNSGSMSFAIKTAASVGSIVPKIRKVVQSADADLPLLEVRTQTEQIDALLTTERIFAMLSSGFGLLALILASIGIYGVMAYTVARRTNEIGIRMALGAEARTVLAMVLRETSVLTVFGILLGLFGALAATRVVGSMLFGLKPNDPVTFAAGALLLLLVALLAATIPAWRAARVDPLDALRHE